MYYIQILEYCSPIRRYKLLTHVTTQMCFKEYCARWKNNLKGIYESFIVLINWNGKLFEVGEQISDCQGLGIAEEREYMTKDSTREIFMVMEQFSVLIGMVVIGIYYDKMTQNCIYTLYHVNFLVWCCTVVMKEVIIKGNWVKGYTVPLCTIPQCPVSL